MKYLVLVIYLLSYVGSWFLGMAVKLSAVPNDPWTLYDTVANSLISGMMALIPTGIFVVGWLIWWDCL